MSKKRFLVRKNCEYSLEVEADDEDEAFREAAKVPDSNWTQAWSVVEAEEEECQLH